MTDKYIIVVGGAGYIGSHTTLHLNEAGYRTIVFDNLITGHESAVIPGGFIKGDLDGAEQVIDYGELACADPYPIPVPIDREGYATVDTSHQFWATGYGDWLNVQQALKAHRGDKPSRLFEFGCATGGFLRHVMLFSDLEPTGSDFAPANVEWVKRRLPTDIGIGLNSSKPSLPYPDNHFDVVTAFSVSHTSIPKKANGFRNFADNAHTGYQSAVTLRPRV